LVDEIFERRWFTNNGQVVRRFERQVADHLGVKHCILVCNATVGLQLACQAMELEGEVILPAFTFAATAHAVSWLKLKPVFADVNKDTHCLCPESVRSLVNENTAAIIGVHLWGNACYPEQLKTIADENDLKLIFDAAHAFHCSHRGVPIGNFGDCEVFSFHATKFFNTFEGGAITTNDDDLAKRIRMMGNFGFQGRDEIASIGTNAKMSEINAAMGVSMFPCIQSIASTNRENFEVYQSILGAVPGLKIYELTAEGRDDGRPNQNWQYVVVEVDQREFGCSRDELVDVLIANDVFAKRYFFPGCHMMKPYRAAFEKTGRTLTNTDYLSERVMCLPTGTAVTVDDLKEICDIVLHCRSQNRCKAPNWKTNSKRIANK
jgi:dTDP-4-amino-4,6-dideoxygalactose transaminase